MEEGGLVVCIVSEVCWWSDTSGILKCLLIIWLTYLCQPFFLKFMEIRVEFDISLYISRCPLLKVFQNVLKCPSATSWDGLLRNSIVFWHHNFVWLSSSMLPGIDFEIQYTTSKMYRWLGLLWLLFMQTILRLSKVWFTALQFLRARAWPAMKWSPTLVHTLFSKDKTA